jgi:hypothetical protein
MTLAERMRQAAQLLLVTRCDERPAALQARQLLMDAADRLDARQR